MVFGMQNEVMARLKPGDDELAVGFRRPVGDMVADRKMLEFGKDAVGAPPVRREQQPIDPLRRVPRTAMPAHLYQPGPDPFRRSPDRDGMGRHGHRVTYQVIAWQAAPALGPRGAVVASEPLQAQVTGCGTGGDDLGTARPHQP
jgi:hypothetical protein